MGEASGTPESSLLAERRGACKTPLGFGFGRFAYPGCALATLGFVVERRWRSFRRRCSIGGGVVVNEASR